MKALKLKKDYLKDYLISLKRYGEVFGPVKKGEKFIYDRLDNFNRLDLTMLRTIIPAKKFLVPPRFNTFSFDEQSYYAENQCPIFIIGILGCLKRAIGGLDKLW